MKKTLFKAILLPASTGLLFASVAFADNTTSASPSTTQAQEPAVHKTLRSEWQQMTPEQRHAKRAEMRERAAQKWEHMTPEQKKKMQGRMQKKWSNMTPTQQKAAKERTRMWSDVMGSDTSAQ